MKIKTFIALSIFSTGALSTAHAADAVMTQEPAPVAIAAPAFSWAGAYIGGQVGYGWASPKINAWTGPDADIPGDVGGNLTIKPKSNGFLGGVYGGYNFDMGQNVVLGVEADAIYARMTGNQNFTNMDGEQTKYSQSLDWAGSVRARAGYAVDCFLPFVTGGVAFGRIKQTINTTSLDPNPVGDDQFTSKSWKTGYTVGAGVDYATTDNVILRLEYRFTDFGKQTEGDNEGGYSSRLRTNDLRLGVAYKF